MPLLTLAAFLPTNDILLLIVGAVADNGGLALSTNGLVVVGKWLRCQQTVWLLSALTPLLTRAARIATAGTAGASSGAAADIGAAVQRAASGEVSCLSALGRAVADNLPTTGLVVVGNGAVRDVDGVDVDEWHRVSQPGCHC